MELSEQASMRSMPAGLFAQPVAVPDLSSPEFVETDLDPYFSLAGNRRSSAGWEEIVAGGLAVLRSDWEKT